MKVNISGFVLIASLSRWESHESAPAQALLLELKIILGADNITVFHMEQRQKTA